MDAMLASPEPQWKSWQSSIEPLPIVIMGGKRGWAVNSVLQGIKQAIGRFREKYGYEERVICVFSLHNAAAETKMLIDEIDFCEVKRLEFQGYFSE